jgi:hypothetical protein
VLGLRLADRHLDAHLATLVPAPALAILAALGTTAFTTSCRTVDEPDSLTERLRGSSDIGKVKPRMQRRYH